MEKIGLIKNNEKMGSYELEKGWASYRTIVDYFIGDVVLCNNIAEIDETIDYNYNLPLCDEDGNNAKEIYQYYVCNVSEYEKEQLTKANILMSYSEMLECDVLCVDHYGTSWDYVLTDVKLFDEYEDLKAYEEEDESE